MDYNNDWWFEGNLPHWHWQSLTDDSLIMFLFTGNENKPEMICMVQTNIGRQCLCANGPSLQEVLTNSQRSAVTQTSQLAGSLFANKCQRMMDSVVSLKTPKDLQWEDRFIITEELIWNTITVEKGSVSVAMRLWLSESSDATGVHTAS